MSTYEVRVLGDLEIVGADGPIDIRPGLPRTLLGMLIARANDVVPSDVLIDQLWIRTTPTNPANALQVQVSYVRRQLRPLGDRPRIDRDGNGYRLVVDESNVDALRFDQIVERHASVLERTPSKADVSEALASLEEALAWWRGVAFADSAHVPLVEGTHHRLEQQRVLAELRRGELLDRLGRHAEAAAWLEPLAVQHSLREDIWAALVGALYRAGRQADALRAYAAARSCLVEELGIEPGPELRGMERAVLAHDPSLLHQPLPDLEQEEPGPRHHPVPNVGVSESPPSRRTTASAGRVPAPITTLVGRAWEVERVGTLVAEHRLVSLTGPGGVGKTRLAFEVARAATSEVRVVELGGASEPSAVPSLIAAVIPVPTDPDVDPIDIVADRIGDADWLLVLDTCEHLVDVLADVTARLLARCPRLRVLTTTRRPLHVHGEVIWPVPLLEVPDASNTRASEVTAASAVRLFVERARAIDPSFVVDDHNAAAVAAICRALDGLPLAIELAASRVGVMSPATIRDRLSDRFALLTSGPRDAVARQRSLQATIEWSADQLDPDQQRVFDSLGVFSGTFDLAAVAMVVGIDEAQALDSITDLVERSMVIADGHDRFRQLDTLRAFSRSRLAGQDGELHRRHACWVRDVVVECDPYSHGPLPAGWPRLRLEGANIRTALEWSFGPGGDHSIGARIVGAIAGSLALAGAFAEASRWLTAAQREDLDDETAATVLRGVAVTELYQRRFAEALAAGERSHARARAAQIPALVASCAITYGSAAWGVGELTRSKEILTEAARTFDAIGDLRGRGFALARLARTLNDLGDSRAVETATAAVDDLEASDDDWVRVVALDHLAYILLSTGDHRSAAVRAEEAIALAERIGSVSGRLAALSLLGRIRFSAGELQEARHIHASVVEAAVQLHNLGAAVDGLQRIADALTVGGQEDLARRVEAFAVSMTGAGVVRPNRRRELAALLQAVH